MNLTKHTPGPWTVRQSAAIDDVRGRWIASVAKSGWCDDAERDANAALIAAAPDLLAALIDAIDIINANCAPRVAAAARAAIAKATPD
jgi:hypothetical protein